MLYIIIDSPRQITEGRDGYVFVGSKQGKVYALKDHDNNGEIDDIQIILDGLNDSSGVAYKNGSLYVAEIDKVWRIDNIEENFPSMPPFEALKMYFSGPQEACPESLVDPYFQFLLETEQSAREYHQLPFAGGLWDQPRQLLDIFTTIRSERNQYERVRFERMKRKSKKGDTSGKALGLKSATINEDLPL